MKKNFICIQCPVGCIIEVEKDATKITGNECKRGEDYVMREIKNPVRMLTTTVCIENGVQTMLPVRSEKEIPKNLIKKCIKELAMVRVKAPVKCGEIVCKNVLEEKINIVASRSMDTEKK